MKKIPLSNGGYALVDNEDYKYLNNWRWMRSNKGYAQRGTKIRIELGKYHPTTVLLHREVMNALKGQQVDHINGNPLDNQKYNLRFSTQKQNLRNKKKHKNNKTGFKGVQIVGAKWRAMIYMNGKNKHLGMFDTPKEAAKAYNDAAFEYDPEFSLLNII